MSKNSRSKIWSILTVLLISCGAAPAHHPGGRTPEPAWPEVRLPGGGAIRVELARTPEERAQGLMFRESMPEDQGMLFVFDEPDFQTFYMKNCFFAQDWLFLDAAGRIVDVLEDRPPCHADPCPTWTSKVKARFVLELRAGVAKRYGLKPGVLLGLPKW